MIQENYDKYVSDVLIGELPKSLINIIWYIWELYCDQSNKENVLIFRPTNGKQRIIIPEINKTFEQDFGMEAIGATIFIRRYVDGFGKIGYYMSRK
jgi:hypothetical protein